MNLVIVSLLFNWPTFGGGNVHTAQLADRLARSGLSVQHLFASYAPWKIGRVDASCPFTSAPLHFSENEWTASLIRDRFRQALELAQPDYVLITDAWNFKPLLAEAAAAFRFLLRLDAQECICPLNNIRLRPSDNGDLVQCSRNCLSTPMECIECVQRYDALIGPLHAVERALSWSADHYHDRLLWAFRAAHAVLTVNPSIASMVEPYCSRVVSVPGGIDPQRFAGEPRSWTDGPSNLLFLGNVEDPLKGFGVLQEACSRLWRSRQDFRVVCASEPNSAVHADFIRYLGWRPHSEVAFLLEQADIVVVPSVCQDAMPLVSLEAMAAARPIVGSRIGGLQYSVADGLTGLLCRPGDADDLASKISMLLDAPELRVKMGLAGRRRIEERYSWDVLIREHYMPLLCGAQVSAPERPH